MTTLGVTVAELDTLKARMMFSVTSLEVQVMVAVDRTLHLLGLAAGTFVVVERPSFWIEFGSRLGQAFLPLAWCFVSRRMPPEEEAAWRETERRGQGDEWLRAQRRRIVTGKPDR